MRWCTLRDKRRAEVQSSDQVRGITTKASDDHEYPRKTTLATLDSSSESFIEFWNACTGFVAIRGIDVTSDDENQNPIRFEEREPISRDPDIVSGTTVFPGTRVPVGILFEYLVDGYSINAFAEQFPTVSQAQIIALLDYVRMNLHKEDNWYSIEESPR